MGKKAGFDKDLLNMENLADYEIAALNAVTSMKLGQMKGEQAMQQLHHATEQELEAARYAAQAGVASIGNLAMVALFLIQKKIVVKDFLDH